MIIVATKYAENPNEPDVQYYFGGFLADCAISGQVGELNSNYSRSIQIFPAYLHPKSRGYITLKSKDPFDPPKIFANYLDEEQDIKALVEGIRFAIRLSETQALKAYGIELDKTPVKECSQFDFGTQVSINTRFLNSMHFFLIRFLSFSLGILGMCCETKYRC